MDDLDNHSENIRDAKLMSLQFKITGLQELILQRFQALTTLSSICFAVVSIIIANGGGLVKDKALAIIASFLLIAIALISFGRHLYLIRSDILGLAQKIKELPELDWNRPVDKSLLEKGFEADWWPETLFVFMVLAIMLFCVSLVKICK